MLAHLGIDLLKRSMVLDQAAVDSVAVEAVDAATVSVVATMEILEAVLVLVVDQAVLAAVEIPAVSEAVVLVVDLVEALAADSVVDPVAVEIPAAADLLCLSVVFHME